ncbi:MAG: cadherin-like beta sandwich domain-containing protein [Coriobacteriia bacterium]|nr:cadherin-like beta sandwich domain-containing protein [Coriobacteriia bacterium]
MGSPKSSKTLLGAALLIAVAALTLSGCVSSAKAPIQKNLSLGKVQVEQNTTSGNIPQQLTEYGVFYSTSLQALKDVNQGAAAGQEATLNISPSVESRYDLPYVKRQLSWQLSASEVGTLTVPIKGLKPGTKYYTRMYAIGTAKGTISILGFDVITPGDTVGALFPIGSITTSNPTLKSLTKSRGTLSPKFSKTKYAYTNTISSGTSKSRISVSPTLAGSSVQMKVGAGAFSLARSKTVSVARHGSKVLTIRVTAPDGITADYVVTIKRK